MLRKLLLLGWIGMAGIAPAPLRSQVALTFEPQRAWVFRTVTAGKVATETATEYDVVICNGAVAARTLPGLAVYGAAAKHVRYLSQGTVQSWITASQATRITLWRAGGYVLAGIGFLGTAVQAGKGIKIDRPAWLAGVIPETTAAIGSAALWWGKNPPGAAVALPVNLLGPFVLLAAAGQPGACAELAMFAAPRQGESGFVEVIP